MAVDTEGHQTLTEGRGSRSRLISGNFSSDTTESYSRDDSHMAHITETGQQMALMLLSFY